MKRWGKFLCLVTGLAGSSGTVYLFSQSSHGSAEPFPGAVVVLESSEWLSRCDAKTYEKGYLWATPETVLYKQLLPHGFQIMRHQVQPTVALNPEPIPKFILTKKQEVQSLSPDGKLLCIRDDTAEGYWHFKIISILGDKPPVIIKTYDDPKWLPDSRTVVTSITNDQGQEVLQRWDAFTGRVSETKLNGKSFFLNSISPEGKILSFFANGRDNPMSWTLQEVQGKRVITTATGKAIVAHNTGCRVSPQCDRLLWQTIEPLSPTWLERMQEKFLKKEWEEALSVRYIITDLYGKHAHVISERRGNGIDFIQSALPHWTPDGKGVHFIKDNKLWYLAVP